MSNARRLVLGTIAVLGVAVLLFGPSAWRAVSLSWAKSKAHEVFHKFDSVSRENLESIPVVVVLPPAKGDPAALDSAEYGPYIVHFPRPTSRKMDGDSLVLTYGKSRVQFRPTFPMDELDRVARGLKFKDSYEYYSATYHSRPSDIDRQSDLRSLRLVLSLLSSKPSAARVIEQFDGENSRGFLIVFNRGRRIVVEAFIRNRNQSCGIWFNNGGDQVNVDDVKAFLADLRFEPKMPAVRTTQAATRTAE